MWLRRINSPIAAELLYSSRHSGGDYSASAMIEKTIALPRLHQGSGPSGNSGVSAQVDPSDAPRPGLSGKVAAPQSDATLLSRSFSALLKIAPSHPVVLLWIASICLKLKRARRAYEVLSRMSVSDWERGVRPKRLTRAAVDIARLGCPAESEDLLRLALAVAPDQVPTLLAVAAMLVERTRQIESQTAPPTTTGVSTGEKLKVYCAGLLRQTRTFRLPTHGAVDQSGSEYCKARLSDESEDMLRLALAVAPELVPALLALAAMLVEKARQIEFRPLRPTTTGVSTGEMLRIYSAGLWPQTRNFPLPPRACCPSVGTAAVCRGARA